MTREQLESLAAKFREKSEWAYLSYAERIQRADRTHDVFVEANRLFGESRAFLKCSQAIDELLAKETT